MHEQTDIGQALVLSSTDWRWERYTTHGPWDSHLGEDRPTHGWTRTRQLMVGAELWEQTEWTFTHRRPADERAAGVLAAGHQAWGDRAA